MDESTEEETNDEGTVDESTDDGDETPLMELLGLKCLLKPQKFKIQLRKYMKRFTKMIRELSRSV